jgi:hypothetical protein
VTDLVKTKSELRAKDVRISSQQEVIEKQGTELEQLRREVSNISAKLQHDRRRPAIPPNTRHYNDNGNAREGSTLERKRPDFEGARV